MQIAKQNVLVLCFSMVASVAAYANDDWEITKPVWEQTQQLVCKAMRQGSCMTFLSQCRTEDGKSMWKFDFGNNELVYYGIDFKERLISKHFRPEFQHMSVQLESSRLITFRYEEDKILHIVKIIGFLLGESYGNVSATQWECFRP